MKNAKNLYIMWAPMPHQPWKMYQMQSKSYFKNKTTCVTIEVRKKTHGSNMEKTNVEGLQMFVP